MNAYSLFLLVPVHALSHAYPLALAIGVAWVCEEHKTVKLAHS